MNLELNFAGNNNASGTMIDDKSKQWFGATVHSSGKDGIIVVRIILSFSSGFWDLVLGSLRFVIGKLSLGFTEFGIGFLQRNLEIFGIFVGNKDFLYSGNIAKISGCSEM